MRGGDLRKPRNDRLAREAQEAADRLARRYEEGERRRQSIREAFDLIEQGTRKFFETERLNASVFIDLQDTMRVVFAQLEHERGISPSDPADPDFGKAGRSPISHSEAAAIKNYTRGLGPRPFFWFGEEGA